MTVEPLPSLRSAPIGSEGDAPLAGTPASASQASSFATALDRAFAGASTALARADYAERAFVHGTGGMQEMIVQRAQADVALSIAGTAASRVSQALGTILGMQV